MEDELLIKFIEHRCTPDEVIRVYCWIHANPQHRQHFHGLQTAWASAQIVQAMHQLTPDKKEIEKILRLAGAKKRMTRRIALSAGLTALAGVAAIFLLLFISPARQAPVYDYLGAIAEVSVSDNIQLTTQQGETVSFADTAVVLNYNKQGDVVIHDDTIKGTQTPVLNTLYVPYGKRSKLILADGTTVHLNSGSSLVYPSAFDKSKREVFLEGEAYFEVQKESGRKFIVRTAFKTIEVLGTRFNVFADKEQHCFEAVLVNGKVALNGEHGTVALAPNQYYGFSAETKHETLKTVDATKYIAWTQGRLSFEREPLKAIIRKLKRIYNIDILLTDERYSDYLISGDLNLKELPEESLNVLMRSVAPGYTEKSIPLYRITRGI